MQKCDALHRQRNGKSMQKYTSTSLTCTARVCVCVHTSQDRLSCRSPQNVMPFVEQALVIALCNAIARYGLAVRVRFTGDLAQIHIPSSPRTPNIELGTSTQWVTRWPIRNRTIVTAPISHWNSSHEPRGVAEAEEKTDYVITWARARGTCSAPESGQSTCCRTHGIGKKTHNRHLPRVISRITFHFAFYFIDKCCFLLSPSLSVRDESKRSQISLPRRTLSPRNFLFAAEHALNFS